MAEAVKRTPGLELLRGKCVLDIKPAGVTKGIATQHLMDKTPFRGALPCLQGMTPQTRLAFQLCNRSAATASKLAQVSVWRAIGALIH